MRHPYSARLAGSQPASPLVLPVLAGRQLGGDMPNAKVVLVHRAVLSESPWRLAI